MRIQDWVALPGRGGVCEPRVVILAKEVELSSMVTAEVTRAPVEVVLMSDGLLGEAVGAW